MKIVLLKSVDNLGQAGQSVEVRRGYFRNYLGPRGMALVATPSNIRFVEQKKNKLAAMVAQEVRDAEVLKGQLEGKSLTFQLRAGERGQLFGSITSRDVAERIKEEFGIDVERRRIDMENLKSLGDHPVKIRVYPGVSATVTIVIEKLVQPGEVFEEEVAVAAPVAEEAAAEEPAES